jgi:signal transduction histidine kinase/ligand-binding sensor domain-containing protein/DNA-binding response OmpR family regulator
MQKLAHPAVQYRLVAYILTLLSLSCNQQSPTASTNSIISEADTTQPFVVNWLGDTILTGIPIKVKGQYYPADSFPEPEPVKVTSQARVIPAYSNQTDVRIKPKVVQVPNSLKTITPGENGVPLLDTVTVNVTVTLVKHPKPMLALQPSISDDAQFDIQYLGTKHGLLSNQINDILSDSKGNLWLATKAGLSRYDGKYFTHYTEKEGLPGNFILDVFEDSQSNLWIEVRENGIVKFDGHHFTHYDIPTSNSITAHAAEIFQEDRNGNIWIGSVYFGLYKYICEEPDNAQFVHYSEDQGLKSPAGKFPLIKSPILIDGKGHIWMANAVSGVIRFDGQSFTYFTEEEGLSRNRVWGLMEDSQGRIWMGHSTGLDVFLYGEEKPSSILQYDFGGRIGVGLIEDDQGDVWYSSNLSLFGDGRLKINESGEITKIIKFDPSSGMSGGGVGAIEMDKRGNIWIGTPAGGVNRIAPHSFKIYSSTVDSLPVRLVSSITEDEKGHYWFGNATSAFFSIALRFDGNNFYVYTDEDGLLNQRVISVFQDSRGHVWFVNFPGLTRYDNDSFYQYPLGSFKEKSNYWMAFEDSEKGIWFSGISATRAQLDGNGKVLEFFSFVDHPYVNGITQIAEDKHGNLWMSTWSAGVLRFKKGEHWGEGEVTFFTENEGLAFNNVQTIKSDSKGNLWIGTNNGLNFLSEKELELDRPHFIHFTEKDGLKSNVISSILEDDDHNIWISTANEVGLFLALDDNDFPNFPQKIPHYKFYSFSYLDGLHQNELLPRAVFKDSKNKLWWGSLKGVTTLDLSNYTPPGKAPQNIHLLELEIDQQHIEFGNLKDTSYQNTLEFGKVLSHSFDSVAPFSNCPVNLRLPHHINHLTFHFSSIDWGAPHKIQYSYRIEGLDNDWSPLQSEPRADYRNLPPGKHTLRVKAIGEAQLWSDSFEYTFIVLPPWWQRWWAYLIYSFIILLFGYFLYQFLLNRRLDKEEARRLRELDEVKTQLYTNITHEFRTPLTIIKGMNQKIIESPEKWLREGTKMISRNSDQLLRLINQILDLRKLESGKMKAHMVQADVIPFLKYLLESFHSYAHQKDIKIHFDSKPDECIMDFDPEKLQQIISNLMSNAIKFTKRGGQVDLIVEKVKHSLNTSSTFDPRLSSFDLLIKVKDTGPGIPPDQLPRIFDRFYQVDDSATREHLREKASVFGEGTGVGLAFTKALVQSLNGDISVSSEVGNGSEFTIHLPISNKAERTEKQPEAAGISSLLAPLVGSKAPVSAPTGKKELPLILIVEDNDDVVQYLISCLEGQYQLDVAKDGQEGIEKALDGTPDLIISDVMMPRKDGFQLTEKLKTDIRTSHIPIILLTAKADVASKLTGLRRGADVYLRKPFHQEELLVRIEKLLELRKRLRKYYRSPFGEKPATGEVKEALDEEGIEHQFVQKARQVVETNLTNYEFRVSDLHEQLNMSHSNLHRKLKALTGFSSGEFIHHVRLEKAKYLLRHTDEPISNIAYDTGYKDPAHFSRVFRKETGVSPSEFRG